MRRERSCGGPSGSGIGTVGGFLGTLGLDLRQPLHHRLARVDTSPVPEDAHVVWRWRPGVAHPLEPLPRCHDRLRGHKTRLQRPSPSAGAGVVQVVFALGNKSKAPPITLSTRVNRPGFSGDSFGWNCNGTKLDPSARLCPVGGARWQSRQDAARCPLEPSDQSGRRRGIPVAPGPAQSAGSESRRSRPRCRRCRGRGPHGRLLR